MNGIIGRVARKLQTLQLRVRANAALRHSRESSLAALRSRRGGRLLIVCHGNIYRSPFVAALLQSQLCDAFEIRSSGFHPVAERRSPERHIALCAQRGVDLASHRSSIITKEALQWADLIVLMDRKNWVALTRLGADEERLVWLGALTSGDVEIADPYGMSDAEAEKIVDRLRDASEQLATNLLRGSQNVIQAASDVAR